MVVSGMPRKILVNNLKTNKYEKNVIIIGINDWSICVFSSLVNNVC